MSYEDGTELSEKLRFIEEVIADIDAIIQKLRAGAYDFRNEYGGYVSDCEYLIKVGEMVIQLANKLKGLDEITDDIIPEIEEVYVELEDATSLTYYYDYPKYGKLVLDEYTIYEIIDRLSSGYEYPDVLYNFLPDKYIDEFEGKVSGEAKELRDWFINEFALLFSDHYYGAFAHLVYAQELLEDYLSDGDKSLLDELIEAGNEIKTDGEVGIEFLNDFAAGLNETIIELLEWLRKLLQIVHDYPENFAHVRRRYRLL